MLFYISHKYSYKVSEVVNICHYLLAASNNISVANISCDPDWFSTKASITSLVTTSINASAIIILSSLDEVRVSFPTDFPTITPFRVTYTAIVRLFPDTRSRIVFALALIVIDSFPMYLRALPEFSNLSNIPSVKDPAILTGVLIVVNSVSTALSLKNISPTTLLPFSPRFMVKTQSILVLSNPEVMTPPKSIMSQLVTLPFVRVRVGVTFKRVLPPPINAINLSTSIIFQSPVKS